MGACKSGFNGNGIKRKGIPKNIRTAYHEAGHAVMACHFEIEFENVSIILNNDEGYWGCFQIQYGEGKKIEQFDDKEKRTIIEKYVMIILAGEIAEFLLTRRHRLHDSLSDYFEAYKLILNLCISSDKFDPDNRETELYMKWLSERCKIILKAPQNWCAVEALAHDLMKGEIIRGREAVEIIKNSRIKNDQIFIAELMHLNRADSIGTTQEIRL